jgi:hypothetical protein
MLGRFWREAAEHDLLELAWCFLDLGDHRAHGNARGAIGRKRIHSRRDRRESNG